MVSNSVSFLGGLAVSIGVGIWKNSEHNDAGKDNEDADVEDRENGISVIADKA